MSFRTPASNRSNWLLLALGLGVVFFIVAVLGQILGGDDDPGTTPAPGTTATPPPPANAIAISIASSNTKEAWLHQAVDAFNAAAATDQNLQVNGRPVFVTILQELVDGKNVDYRSGTMVSDTLAERIQPTIVSPGDVSWLSKLEREWDALKGGDPISAADSSIVVRTPLVVAMWQSRAAALDCWPNATAECTWERLRALATAADGWGSEGHPEWRTFKFGYGYFGESNSGTLAISAMCSVGLGKTSGLTVADVEPANGCGTFITEIERAKVHSGKSDVWLLDQMTGGGPEYLDGVVTYESNVVARNKSAGGTLREPLVSVYPQDGTIVVGHPFAILDGASWVTDEQVNAAGVLRDYLMSGAQQAKVLELGLRPADESVPLTSPIEPGLGANPEANLVPVQVPDTLVIDRIGEVWHQVRKHAAIAIVFDKSGSMADDGKITYAVKGAQEFVRRMEPQDTLIWMPFDDQIYTPVRGRASEIAEQLISVIGGTPAEGGTALYDAVLAAYGELSTIRQTEGDALRYGIVVLSDGQDQNSQQSLAQLEAALAPAENDPTGIQIHTIAIGDADEAVLKKISGAAHGRFWKTQQESEVVNVYRDIAAYF
jgi:Ca-activated chloride channel family protein